jgi:hypothetical protein
MGLHQWLEGAFRPTGPNAHALATKRPIQDKLPGPVRPQVQAAAQRPR